MIKSVYCVLFCLLAQGTTAFHAVPSARVASSKLMGYRQSYQYELEQMDSSSEKKVNGEVPKFKPITKVMPSFAPVPTAAETAAVTPAAPVSEPTDVERKLEVSKLVQKMAFSAIISSAAVHAGFVVLNIGKKSAVSVPLSRVIFLFAAVFSFRVPYGIYKLSKILPKRETAEPLMTKLSQWLRMD